ncbi:MAG: class I SAM-dependent methyltransferase [Saprospiraceae bacterium]
MTDIEMFANRLAKMYKHITKWARRKGISCYRIYDHDIPQFPFAIDRYDTCLYISEYETGYYMEPEEREEWFNRCITAIALQTETTIDKIFFKTRKQQKGKTQYEKTGAEEHFEMVVQENGLKFKINLSDYLDTGLFLDHRPLRELVKIQAKDKNVLNLFAYTGSFSVYAASGEAALVVTIDLSATYLNWAVDNLELNGLYDPEKHYFVQDDVKVWLQEPPDHTKFDIIIMDPPTFSNSKRMTDVLDIQRDHVELINQALDILNPGGRLYFSTNFRRFKMDAPSIKSTKIKDITAMSIPEDFRDKKIHFCFQIDK